MGVPSLRSLRSLRSLTTSLALEALEVLLSTLEVLSSKALRALEAFQALEALEALEALQQVLLSKGLGGPGDGCSHETPLRNLRIHPPKSEPMHAFLPLYRSWASQSAHPWTCLRVLGVRGRAEFAKLGPTSSDISESTHPWTCLRVLGLRI